jgi:hypothetical protein
MKNFRLSVSKGAFDRYSALDKIRIVTRSGYYGMTYYTDFNKVGNSYFPPGTYFPITEEELELLRKKNN